MEKYYDLWVDLSRADGCCVYTKKIMDKWDNTRLSNEELGKIVNGCIDEAINCEAFSGRVGMLNSEERKQEIRQVTDAS